MRKTLLILLLLGICLCSSIIVFVKNNHFTFVPATTQIEIISDDNNFKIGQEVLNQNGPEVFDDVNNPEFSVLDVEIPENPFFDSIASNLCLPGDSIQEIVTSDNIVPEIIIPNGAVGVFSKGNLSGWPCETGSTLSYSFEKYPMENGTNQTLGVGYIKDGVMYEMQVFKDSLDGEYNLVVPEDGTYYIYVIGLSSDPISLKKSDIQIK